MTEMVTGLEPVSVPQPKSGSFFRSTLLHSIAGAVTFLIFQLFTPAVFYHAGLKNGVKGVWWSVAGTLLLLGGVAAMATAPNAVPPTVSELGRMLLTISIPAAIGAMLMRRRTPSGTVVLLSVAVSVAGFILLEGLMRATFGYSPYGDIVRNFRIIGTQSMEIYRKSGITSPDALRWMQKVTDVVGQSFVGLMLTVFSALTFVVSSVLVPRFAAGRATGESYLFRSLAFPDAMLFLFVAGGLSPLAQGTLRLIGLNLLGVMVFLYWLQGLAVMRAVLARMGAGPFATVFAFFIVAMMTPYVVVPFILFLVGLFDPFFNFRHPKRKDDSDESDFD